MSMRITWGDSLERLADRLFDELETTPPLKPKLVVVNSRVTEGWLRHHFVYARRGKGRQRVLANWDVRFLHVFVNDWLHRMQDSGAEERDARTHPYSRLGLEWRIYGALTDDLLSHDDFAPLRRYLTGDSATLHRYLADGSPRRRFALAGEIARLFDDYQVYRPEMLGDWEEGRVDKDDKDALWQAALWKALIDQDPASYADPFRRMREDLRECGIERKYDRVSAFDVSPMPPAYMAFFTELAGVIPVDLYLLNPSRTAVATDAPEGAPRHNPLLDSLGTAARECLSEARALAGEDAEVFEAYQPDAEDTALHVLQSDIRNDRGAEGGRREVGAADDSIRIHLCHSPLREVEVLRDRLLKWFQEDATLQPRDVQVQVTDMATYTPYIDAVFATADPDEGRAVPYVVADRYVMATSQTAKAFVDLLALPQSRLKATEVMDLLECEAVRERFGLGVEDVGRLREWVRDSGARWGLDRAHRKQVTGADFEEATTWRRGIDRMLLGYAMGPALDPDEPALCDAGELGRVLPFDEVEGSGADAVGRLARFLDELRKLVSAPAEPRPIAEWAERLGGMIDRFFISASATYGDVLRLRDAVKELATLGEKAGVDEPVPLDVAAAFLEAELADADSAGSLTPNAVVFSALRPMSSAPRRIMCLLGMSDGLFPHSDARPRFDLLGRERRRGDPSRRLADRHAFLEALLCARERLHISYVGRTAKENEETPPSVVVSELRDDLKARFGMSDDETKLLPCETLHHLQAFHPDDFAADGGPFSYSLPNLAAAKALLGEREAEVRGAGAEVAAPEREGVTLRRLQAFFRNPAKHYFVETLQARLDAEGQTVLSDTESFAATGLEGYEVDQVLLDACLRDRPLGDVGEELRERGVLPLGAPGRVEVEERFEDIRAWLGTEIEAGGEGLTRGELLASEREPLDVALPLDEWRIEGRVEVRSVGGRPALIFARYAVLKPKDLLAAWLSHLLAGAAGNPTETVVLGLKRDARFAADEPGDPAGELAALVALVEEGRSAPLRFAPATSHDYWAEYASPKKAPRDDAEKRRAALAKARAAWEPSDYARGESEDPYLARAFGEQGPMFENGQPSEAFHRIAEAVFAPLLRAGGAA